MYALVLVFSKLIIIIMHILPWKGPKARMLYSTSYYIIYYL